MTRLSLLPPPFVHRMLTAFGQDSHALKEARALLKSILTTAPVTSFRRNPLKTNIHTYMGDGIIVAVNNLNSAIPTCTTPTTTATTTPIPWFPSLGRFASPRPNYALDPLFYAGAIYPQDASSMLFQRAIPHLHQQQQQQLQYQPITKILDLCSAPGGKSGVMASMSSPLSTVIVSNELVSNRASILEENLAKGAFPSSIVTQNRSVDFLDAGLQEYFDVVVVDGE